MKPLAHLPIRILTHNIRYATPSPFPGEEPWETRAPRLINELRFHTLYNPESFICLQEVLHSQLRDILAGLNNNSKPIPNPSYTIPLTPVPLQHLNPDDPDYRINPEATPEWAYIGVARDDGLQAGEYSPILYRPATWSLQHFTTRWLSPTPNIPSKGWDAASIRILTIGVFKHRESKRRVVAMNTHLDDQGSVSRWEGARMILREMRGWCGLGEGEEGVGVGGGGGNGGEVLPVFLAGDLNSEPGQEAYQVLAAEDSVVEDALGLAGDRAYGHSNTFTGFDGKTSPTRIDFLFLGPKEEGMWGVRGYAVLENRFEDGVYDSDHRAVVGDFVLGG